MPPSPGIRLGPYEIVAPLGAGGMGEVDRADDTRLGRDVAVNVLPDGTCGARIRFISYSPVQEVSPLLPTSDPPVSSLHVTKGPESVRHSWRLDTPGLGSGLNGGRIRGFDVSVRPESADIAAGPSRDAGPDAGRTPPD